MSQSRSRAAREGRKLAVLSTVRFRLVGFRCARACHIMHDYDNAHSSFRFIQGLIKINIESFKPRRDCMV